MSRLDRDILSHHRAIGKNRQVEFAGVADSGRDRDFSD